MIWQHSQAVLSLKSSQPEGPGDGGVEPGKLLVSLHEGPDSHSDASVCAHSEMTGIY